GRDSDRGRCSARSYAMGLSRQRIEELTLNKVDIFPEPDQRDPASCRGPCMINGISPYRCGFNLKVDNASAPTRSIVVSIADPLDRLRPEIEAQLKPNLQGIFGGVIRGYLPQAWAYKTEAVTVTLSVDSHGNVSLRSGGSLN